MTTHHLAAVIEAAIAAAPTTPIAARARRLADVRAAIAADRADVDQALIELVLTGRIELEPVIVGSWATDADRAAAITIGGESCTLVALLDDDDTDDDEAPDQALDADEAARTATRAAAIAAELAGDPELATAVAAAAAGQGHVVVVDPIGLADIADIAGVRAATVKQWRRRGILPAPAATVASTPCWARAAVTTWLADTGRPWGATAGQEATR
jgi:hypothetical protein